MARVETQSLKRELSILPPVWFSGTIVNELTLRGPSRSVVRALSTNEALIRELRFVEFPPVLPDSAVGIAPRKAVHQARGLRRPQPQQTERRRPPEDTPRHLGYHTAESVTDEKSQITQT